MDHRRNLVFNGKYLSGSLTGVHRVAHELISAYCELQIEEPRPSIGIRILTPKTNKILPKYAGASIESAGIFTWQLWEQIDLVRKMRRDHLLINLCNLGPVIHSLA